MGNLTVVLLASLNPAAVAGGADIGDAVLAATVRAAGDVQFQFLIEAWQPLVQFFCQPAREAFRLGDSQFAEFRSTACNSPAHER